MLATDRVLLLLTCDQDNRQAEKEKSTHGSAAKEACMNGACARMVVIAIEGDAAVG